MCERQTLKTVFHPNPKTVFSSFPHPWGGRFLVHLNRPKFPEIVFVLHESRGEIGELFNNNF